MKNDYTLILKKVCHEDDSLSFRLLMEKLSDKLYEFANFYLKDKEYAEEVVSDVFFKFWANRKKLSNIKNLESYLYTSVKNQSLNYIDKYQKVRKLDVNELSVTELISKDLNPESVILLDELVNKINDAIRNLPERCQMIFKMVRQDGMSYKQVAQIMGISTNTVKEQMARAIKSIRKEVEAYNQTEKKYAISMGKVVKMASYSAVIIFFTFFFIGL